MRRWHLVALTAALALGHASLASPASAGQKLAIFPFDLSFPKSEEDFFFGQRGPSPDEQRRLDLARADITQRFAESGRYEILDVSPIAADLTAAQPFYDCNGCELDLAKKVNADFVMTASIDKISETHLSLNVAIIDVAGEKIVSNSSVLIQGNTDEAWLHGVKWLTKNRLLANASKSEPAKPEGGKGQ